LSFAPTLTCQEIKAFATRVIEKNMKKYDSERAATLIADLANKSSDGGDGGDGGPQRKRRRYALVKGAIFSEKPDNMPIRLHNHSCGNCVGPRMKALGQEGGGGRLTICIVEVTKWTDGEWYACSK
jgi:hypothetical protein